VTHANTRRSRTLRHSALLATSGSQALRRATGPRDTLACMGSGTTLWKDRGCSRHETSSA